MESPSVTRWVGMTIKKKIISEKRKIRIVVVNGYLRRTFEKTKKIKNDLPFEKNVIYRC